MGECKTDSAKPTWVLICTVAAFLICSIITAILGSFRAKEEYNAKHAASKKEKAAAAGHSTVASKESGTIIVIDDTKTANDPTGGTGTVADDATSTRTPWDELSKRQRVREMAVNINSHKGIYLSLSR